MKTISAKCPVCTDKQTECLLYRAQVPVHQNMICQVQEDAVNIKRGDLAIRICGRCGFVFNEAFDPALMSYDQHYNNSQNYSSVFSGYTGSLAQSIVRQTAGKPETTIIEVGCGKGSFLHQLFDLDDRLTGYGFDPSYDGPEKAFDGRLGFIKDLYGPKYEHIPADIVVCRHVIEHIPDPVGLLSTVRKALRNSPQARVFFETPCIEWIFNHHAVWDFFYEHCSYFSAASLTKAFQQAGFKTEQISHVFNGQYLWLEASLNADNPAKTFDLAGDPLSDTVQVVEAARQYRQQENNTMNRWRELFHLTLAEGPLAIWGAGAKGVTFAQLFDPERTHISCIVDINPNKQGQYLPGTGHPIVHCRDLPDLGIRNVILMNPNYKTEVQHLLAEHELPVNLMELE
ncbi:hypothetical protein B1222_11950 [Paenibacillus larvae subsp. pulvifaciens]|nr:class I SAM-dependent methyltransferase [Paenibacillus larvae]AQT84938.1 hypothetical protein B1222_11950 [Paenibacillus larvae subsp. pulvifaciens]MBH0343026.1 hypothetical protein [Paenibacillus larvae]MCY7519885.1 methyltransferase domain-containing protein [Paenibacillus larvae]MCY9499813.1 methyltransferase domain-containing protein [Paenibacillus larvae]MCY9677626.1 methyltransferase domain-containing protein [Paenibacillus larvae]